MSIKPRFYALAVLSLGVFLSANVSADIVISDNFDGTAGVGPVSYTHLTLPTKA